MKKHRHTKDPCKRNYCQKNTSVETILRLIKKDIKKVHFVKKRNLLFVSHVEKYLQVTEIERNTKKSALHPHLT